MSPKQVVWTEGEVPTPVTPEHPLVGLETRVLQTWLENSPALKAQYEASPRNRASLENAVRLKLGETFAEELKLRAQGMTQEQAEEFTRPAMWTPPTWHPTPPLPAPRPEENPPDISSSTTPAVSPTEDGLPNSTITSPPSDF